MLLSSFLTRSTLLRSFPATANRTATCQLFSSTSLGLVKSLRQKTGAPILECKKALAAVDNDLDQAVDHLRKLGVAAAAKRSGNSATEGLVAVAVSEDGKRGAAVELNSETDFVARNALFQGMLSNIAAVALDVVPEQQEGTATSDITQQLLAHSIVSDDGTTSTVGEAVEHLSGVIRENIQLRRASMMTIGTATNGKIGQYVHNAIGPNQGGIGCMVAIGVNHDENNNDAELMDAMDNVGRSVSLHIAAARPLYLDVDSIPVEDLEREKSVHTELGLASGKPANIVEKMVTGKMRKYYEENVLVNQKSFVDEDGLPMSKVVTAIHKNATIDGFIRMEVGEDM
jgi:elongation factor Ts